MIVIHEHSDDAILAGAAYFRAWRSSRNALLLFDALAKINLAERVWIVDRGANLPMRREWQVLRRCVMRAMEKLHEPLLAATSPSQTERALFPKGGKRATLARADQLNRMSITIALIGSTIDQAHANLKSMGISRKRGYLKKLASEMGFTRRPARTTVPQPTASALRRRSRSIEVSSSGLRHRGSAY
ncbi:hypothetical protein [Pararobbsia silviterrae]|uniref:hypothetical protein n=1 Tax=Pararobbsia silviterrae TaxID=1792498 RepID=UPI0011C35AB2|nr:hypothetical protein [Pararobbsia silviterrae]